MKAAGRLANQITKVRSQFTGTALRTPTPELSQQELNIETLGQLALDLNKTTVYNFGAGMAAPQLGEAKRMFVIRHEFFTLTSPLTGIPYSQGTSKSYNALTPASACVAQFRSNPALLIPSPNKEDIADLAPSDVSKVYPDTFQGRFRAFLLQPRQQEALVLDLLREALQKKTPSVAVMNPQIVAQSEETFIGNEGCFSVPDWQAAVVRPLVVDFEFLTFDDDKDADPKDPPKPFDPSNEFVVKKTVTLREFAARAFLHELDHLEGTVFVDRAEADSFYFVANGGEVIYADELNDNELKRSPPLSLQYPVPRDYDAFA